MDSTYEIKWERKDVNDEHDSTMKTHRKAERNSKSTMNNTVTFPMNKRKEPLVIILLSINDSLPIKPQCNTCYFKRVAHVNFISSNKKKKQNKTKNQDERVFEREREMRESERDRPLTVFIFVVLKKRR